MRNLAGRLNRKIELWENVKTESVNAIGQTKWEGRKVRDLWAEVRPQTGSLLNRTAETKLSRTTHKIIIRYIQDVTPGMWFMAGGQRYDIIYILDPYLAHDTLEIFCEAVE
ncbi:phage head closure protein [Anaerotignum sp. MSJ-24]|uniref:phage head closure protein n=1 Tax=Anaerotignum sp. MSJ-24 TaxID=2841521 RepID=UPI001C122719|nr:phage head closure protein [Anaerotignum sp. MSJ-24]MBU5464966.1 phage head closure protein [Anaerotignum sp. MSJ-24]